MRGGAEHGSINLSGDPYGLDDGVTLSFQCRCGTAKTVTSKRLQTANQPRVVKTVSGAAPMRTLRDGSIQGQTVTFYHHFAPKQVLQRRTAQPRHQQPSIPECRLLSSALSARPRALSSSSRCSRAVSEDRSVISRTTESMVRLPLHRAGWPCLVR